MVPPDETEPTGQPDKTPQPSNKKEPLSIKELQEFADLLILLRENESYFKLVDTVIDGQLNPRCTSPIHGHTSYDRYIADIALYLRHHKHDLLWLWTDKSRQTPEKINKKIQARKSKEGPRADQTTFDFTKEHWIRNFMTDLDNCFVAPERSVENRRVLKDIEVASRVFTVYFWHWTNYVKREKALEGKVITGTLEIYGDWISGQFSYVRPDGVVVSYRSPIRPGRRVNSDGRPPIKNYYLSLRGTATARKAVDDTGELTLVLAVRQGHPDNTFLTGTFAGTDPVYGYPLTGCVCLIGKTLLQVEAGDSPERQAMKLRKLADLEVFAHNYVAYHTTLLPDSSFDIVDELPNFLTWQSQKRLFDKPLHGYFYKATQGENPNQINRHIVHFTLTVDPAQSGSQPSPALIEYEGEPEEKANKGYVTIEQHEGNGLVVFRGEFDYLTDQHRFRLQILFTRSTSANTDWYVGTIMGLNRSRNELLTGRFALRQEPLASVWLDPANLGELLLQHDQVLGAFLLEIDQQIPSETLPLYNQLGWPHIPRIEQAFNEVTFDSTLAGEYGCYALIRVRSETVTKSDTGKLEETNPDTEAEDLLDDTYLDDDDDDDDEEEKDDDQYLIARYPLKIFQDGRLEMKFSKQDLEGKVTPVQYHGRAFHQPDAGRLFLYFDTREMGKIKDRLHVSMYFEIKPNSKISRAFGVSNRFINTEFAPEARMEVLAALKGSTYKNTEYKTYDPFLKSDLSLLNRQSRRLGKYLSGRANRLILPYSGFRPDDSKPVPTRRKAFRRLHIRAALYEIEHGGQGVKRCVKLLRNAYLHGFGIKDDITFLTLALTKTAFSEALKGWSVEEKVKLNAELKNLWPKLPVVL